MSSDEDDEVRLYSALDHNQKRKAVGKVIRLVWFCLNYATETDFVLVLHHSLFLFI
jgi:hypothetical protein